MKRFLLFFVIALLLLGLVTLGIGGLILVSQRILLTQNTSAPPTPAAAATNPATANRAKGEIQVIGSRFTNQFPNRLLFELEAQSDSPITQVALFAQVDGIAASSRQIPEFTTNSRVQAKYEWNLGRSYLPPGVTGQFWWMVRDSAGNELQTAKSAFRVEDTGYAWKELSNAKLALHWYAGGDNFGQALFQRAVSAMGTLERDTEVAVERPVHMWIYGRRSDYFGALEPGAVEWTGGRAFPEFSVIAINIEPNQLEWGKRAATHELAHILIREQVRGPLGALGLPQWLDEGLAVYYETIPGALDEQFQLPLDRAIRAGRANNGRVSGASSRASDRVAA